MKPIRPNSTSKARDDLVYIYKEKQYSMYQVLEILDDNYYDCVELNIEEKIFTRHASLNFGKVGVFKYHGLTTIKRNIHIEEINGKVVMNQNLLMTVPMNVLTQV